MKTKIQSENLLIYDEILYEGLSADFEAVTQFGGFEKKILLLTGVLTEGSDEQILFQKMITAVGLNEQDILHISVEKTENLKKQIAKLRPEKIICFGPFLESDSSQFSNFLFTPIDLSGCQYLVTQNLSNIAQDNTLKQALWNGLKKMFSL